MPRGEPSNGTKQQRATEKDQDPKRLARPGAESCTWAAANKLHAGGKQMEARRKLPSGPLGGSGRKTNRARSS